MAPQPQSGRASRCVLRDRRSVVTADPHGCRRGGTRHAQFLPRPVRRNRGRQHLPPDRLDTSKMIAAVQRSRAIKEERKNRSSMTKSKNETHEAGEGCFQSDLVSEEAALELAASIAVPASDDSDDGREDQSEESDDAMEGSESNDVEKRRIARLQNYACPRLRRKALMEWVSQRVQEISREDDDDPDNEDQDIRTALMDAIGLASVNVEADLRDVGLDFSRQVSQESVAFSRQVSAEEPEEPGSPLSTGFSRQMSRESCTSQESRIRFADNAVTYLLKPDSEAGPLSIAGPRCWTLDRVLETDVLDSPSAPLSKW